MTLSSMLSSRLTRARLDHEEGQLHLHAAGVVGPGYVPGVPQPGAVLLGKSGSGKSTLTTMLVNHGWGYLTDEMLGFDPQPGGRARPMPYPKAISLKGDALELLPELDAYRNAKATEDLSLIHI